MWKKTRQKVIEMDVYWSGSWSGTSSCSVLSLRGHPGWGYPSIQHTRGTLSSFPESPTVQQEPPGHCSGHNCIMGNICGLAVLKTPLFCVSVGLNHTGKINSTVFATGSSHLYSGAVWVRAELWLVVVDVLSSGYSLLAHPVAALSSG